MVEVKEMIDKSIAFIGLSIAVSISISLASIIVCTTIAECKKIINKAEGRKDEK